MRKQRMVFKNQYILPVFITIQATKIIKAYKEIYTFFKQKMKGKPVFTRTRSRSTSHIEAVFRRPPPEGIEG